MHKFGILGHVIRFLLMTILLKIYRKTW